MNLTLSNVIQTSANANSFMEIPEIYIRGTQIKYLRLQEEIMNNTREQNNMNLENRNRNQKRRGIHNSSNNNYSFNNNRRGRGSSRANDGYFSKRRGNSGNSNQPS